MAAWLADAKRLTGMDWVSTALLAAAILILALALGSTWSAAAHPTASGCHNAPLKVIRYPQLTGIAVCIGGLVIGRLITRPVISSRKELNDRLAPHHEPHRHGQYALLTQAALTAALFFITFLVTFESLTLWRSVWPVTYYVRCAAEAATWQTYTAAFFLCLLVGRWLWLPKTPK
jgi:hypothetical protein